MLSRDEARQYAAHLIAREQFDWDEIAERHPSGEILEQEDCDLVAEALYSCAVTFEWPDGQRLLLTPEDR